MSVLEFITQYLSSPIVAHRDKALMCLFEEVKSNKKVIKQLGVNISSDNLDIVLNSLRILQAISLENENQLKSISIKIAQVGKKTDHFAIAFLCSDILVNIQGEKEIRLAVPVSDRIKPNITADNDTEMFFDNCDHFLEYSLGAKEYRYQLSNICRAFRYDCKKATKQVFTYMRVLGYRKNIQYWKEKPSRWRNDFEGNRYETRLQYYARHSIYMFLMWCVEHLTTTDVAWSELLMSERKWDASIPKLNVVERPSFLRFTDLETNTEQWVKRRIKKSDAYELFNPKAVWFPLYESTDFKHEDKSFDRYVATSFIQPPISNISKKIEFFPPHYSCRGCYVNELPTQAAQDGRLYLDDTNSRADELKNKLLPTYGIVTEDFDDYVKLFPTLEIMEHFKLHQKKNSLDYYKGKELVVRCINWRDGYYRNVGRQGEDRFELANHGHLLLIKTKYLKRYLKEKNLKVIVVGRIWKHKVDKWSREYNFNDKKSSKNKWLSFEAIGFD
jgi:hypothetical protein